MVPGDASSLNPLKKKKLECKVVMIVENYVTYSKYNNVVRQYLVKREPSTQTVNVRPRPSLISLVPLPPLLHLRSKLWEGLAEVNETNALAQHAACWLGSFERLGRFEYVSPGIV